MCLINDSNTIPIESWFFGLDISSMISTILAIGLATFFLFVIYLDKTCHTVPMMLVANSFAAELILAINSLWMTGFSLHNDLQQIHYQDSFCVIRGYLSYSSCALQNFSYLLQGIHRYLIVVHPNRLLWQSTRAQLLLIMLIWIFVFLFPIPFMFTGEIIYNVNNQICQVPLRFSISIIYLSLCLYIIPVSLLMFIYLKLIRYVKGMSKRVTLGNVLLRAQRELRMVRRIVILVMVLFAAGFPYTLFAIISFFSTPPTYHFRIAYSFLDLSLVVAMISLFQFTEILKTSVKKILQCRPNRVLPVFP